MAAIRPILNLNQKQMFSISMGGTTPPELDRKEILQNLRKDLPMIIDYIRVNAEVTRQNYLALLKNNFTEQQALYICSKQPLIQTGGN
jgi:hypothetical protein